MSKKLLLLALVLGAIATTAPAAVIITGVAHRNTDTDATEDPVIAPDPLDDQALCFVDRTHVYTDIPEYLIGADYIMTANDNKNQSAYELDITFSADATLFVFVDNRMGGSAGGLDVEPNIDGMPWLTEMGFVDNGDDIGIDESADGSINQYFSIFALDVKAGTTTIFGNTQGHGGNMLGVAAISRVPDFAAYNPVPAEDALDVWRTANLSWVPSMYAQTHDVYLGTSFDDVNEASRAVNTTLVGQGQDANSFDAGILDYGQTYYWRIDEVNGAPDFTIFKGEVWNFTVEPFAYPVTDITATASGSNDPAMGPEKTIDGSGLDAQGQHSTLATDMWLSAPGAEHWIQYEFAKDLKLHEMWVWNSNQMIEAFIGLGAKDVIIETSLDGAAWTVLEGPHQFAQAPGNVTYTANTIVDFGGTMARFVRITVNTGWGLMPQYGLSEVRFFAIPVQAREPQPADGSTTDGVDVLLAWRAGREAVTHEVNLGTDSENLALIGTTNEASFDPGELSYSTTYFWRVDEVNEAGTPALYVGDVWSFTTSDYGTVDDFDQYDDDCERIFFAWEDGLGHSGGEEIEGCDVPASNGNGGGSIVGNDQAPFAERNIVTNGSTQSMPFNYDNSFGPSEATLRLGGQDWTASGVQTLSLAFYGALGNTGTLYVKINNTKVTYDLDPGDIGRPLWQIWNIDLSALGGLQNVTSLSIGVDGASAAGMLYIDDIRLYPVPPEAPEQVWLEAEGANVLGASWLVSDDTAASGGRYIGSDEGQGNDNDAAPGPEWIATYDFNVSGGVYKILLRGQEVGADSFWVRITTATSQTHEDPDQVGTGWVRFNGMEAPDEWTWDEVHSNDHSNAVVNWTLEAGAHTLEIGKREDAVLLDAIVITDDVN